MFVAAHDYGEVAGHLSKPSARSCDSHNATMNHDKTSIQLQLQHTTSETSTNGATSSANSSDGSNGVFNFFGLPRELRDKIYEQPVLFEYQHLPTTADGQFFIKAKKLRTSLLLVNSHFKREYSERCNNQQVLCFRDHSEATPECIHEVTARDKAERWRIDYCIHQDVSSFAEIEDDIDSLETFLERFTPVFPTLRSLSIKLYISDVFFVDVDTALIMAFIKEQISRIIDFPKVRMLEVYRIARLYRHKKASEPRTLLARWKSKGNMPLEFLDTPVVVDGTESECEAFKGKRFHDGSSNEDSDEAQCDSDSAPESSSYDDDEAGDDDSDSDDRGDFPDSDAEHSSFASENEDESDSEDGKDADKSGNGDEEDHDSSSTDEVVDAEPEPPASYFDFFGLPRELRNMIYEQPCMLVEQTLAPINEVRGDVFAVKPRESLLLVNHQFKSEYMESCEGRLEVHYSANIFEFMFLNKGPAIPQKAAQQANFLHVRVGHLLDDDSLPEQYESVKQWLELHNSRMPGLRSITIQCYTEQVAKDSARIKTAMADFLELDKLDLCQFIFMEHPATWESLVQKKELLLQWKRGDSLPRAFNNPPLDFVEPCCKRLAGKPHTHMEDAYNWIDS